jgi:uroporphyrinogen decarboxylase
MKKPSPDASYFLEYIMGRTTGNPPLIEYLVDEIVMRPIIENILNRQWVNPESDRESLSAWLDNSIEFWYRMGYDFVRFEQNAGFPTAQLAADDPTPGSNKIRLWADQHHGLIASWDDFERYPWPEISHFDFYSYEYINDHLPEGMGLIISHAAGVFEHLSQIFSYEGLCTSLYDQPDLVSAVANALGSRMTQFYEHILSLDRVIALFPGDDMGFRTGTLIGPTMLRKFVLPWHKKFAQLAHHHNKPYFIHSCGNIAAIMEDLIEDVKIDGKHSFEDAILPVDKFQEIYGKKIAVLGGVDVNILARGSTGQVRQKVRELIEVCGARGRFALGSGNSIPSYIPVQNYLAMVDEARA